MLCTILLIIRVYSNNCGKWRNTNMESLLKMTFSYKDGHFSFLPTVFLHQLERRENDKSTSWVSDIYKYAHGHHQNKKFFGIHFNQCIQNCQ